MTTYPPLKIELVSTDNDACGPCPPIGDGWVVVRRDGEVTLWRRITCVERTRATP
jgi:hypothetical protein